MAHKQWKTEHDSLRGYLLKVVSETISLAIIAVKSGHIEHFLAELSVRLLVCKSTTHVLWLNGAW